MANQLDPFAQFGGQSLEADSPPGTSRASEGEGTPDPFTEFGGQAEPATAPLQKEERKFTSRPVSDDEVQVIAEHHGLKDWRKLSSAIEFLGGSRATRGEDDDVTATLKAIGGFAGDSLAFGLPQKAWIASQDDPKLRAALDDMRTLIDEKKGWGRMGAELGAGLGSAVGLGRGAAKVAGTVLKEAGAVKKATTAYDVASAAGGGAAAGLGHSREGEELKDTATGAALGLGAYGVLAGAGKVLGKVLSKSTSVEKAVQEEGPEFAEALAKEAEKTSDVDAVSARAISQAEDADALKSVQTVRQFVTDEDELARAAKQALEDMDTGSAELLSKELDDLRIPPGPERDAYVLQRRIETDTIELASYVKKTEEPLSLAKAREVLSDLRAREGQDYVAALYADLRDVRNTRQLVADSVVRSIGTEGGTVASVLKNGWRDARYAYNRFDARLGTSSTAAIDRLSEATNRMTVRLAEDLPAVTRLTKETSAAGIDERALYQALDKGTDVDPDSTAGQVVQGWRDFFEKLRLDANEAFGADVVKPFTRTLADGRQVTAYVPHYMTARDVAADRMRQVIERIDARTGSDLRGGVASPEALKALKADPEWQGLADAVKYVEDVGGRQVSIKDVGAAYSRLTSGKALPREKLSEASATFERVMEEVPELLRETDVSKLAVRWMTGTFKHAYMRRGLMELEKFRNIAAARGDKDAARYAQNHIMDLVAPRTRDTLANALSGVKMQTYLTLQGLARKHPVPGLRLLADMLGEDSQWMGNLVQQVYPNFLGFSVRAAITNLTQPFLVTMPELGYRYGVPAVAKAYATAAMELSKGKTFILKDPVVARMLGKQVGEEVTTRNMAMWLRNEGQLASPWNTELRDALSAGFKSGWKRTGDKVMKRYEQTAMYLYEGAEKMNRLVALEVSDDLARSLVRGDVEALRVLQRMEPAYRTEVGQALRAGNEQQVRELVRSFVVGKTIFNYNRAALSAYGRAAGHLMSTFTKWPLSVASDVAEKLEQQGVGKGSIALFSKYLLPFIALSTFSGMLNGDEEPSPEAQFLFGKAGIESAAPVGSLKAVAQGDLLAPPAVGVPAKFLQALLTGDPDKAYRAAENAFSSFAPGAGLLRFFFVDLPKALGDLPEEKTAGEAVSQLSGD